MKQNTSYQRAVQFLAKAFRFVNEDFFNNELPETTITIQSSPRAHGHFLCDSSAWSVSNPDGTTKSTYEINISAGTMSRDITNVIATLIHECTHLYCFINGIKDTSNGGAYHNKRFRDEAEKRGLKISHGSEVGMSHIGYSVTEPTERIVDFCIEHDLENILIHRNEYGLIAFVGGAKSGSNGITASKPKGSHSVKWICPECRQTVRSTKPEVNIICGDCGVQFVKA